MGYYHIELSAKSKELCTIVTQWGKYEYQRLPMGLCNIPDIFQEKMPELFIGLDTVRVYTDDLLHVTKCSWTEHLSILKEMFTRLQKAGLKVNARKSCFGAHKFYYLGYHITREGVMPIPKIQYLLFRLEGFRYGTTLDLNMGYYHSELIAN